MTGPRTEVQGPRLAWQPATVEAIKAETYRVKTFTLRPARWRRFRPGQHVDIRLTASDGYQAQRSYSIASAPEASGTFDLGVELVEGGEVSPFFHEVMQLGDQIEVRGPIGGPFTWTTGDGGPVLLIAAGSGIVPIMSMLRHRRAMMLFPSGAQGAQMPSPWKGRGTRESGSQGVGRAVPSPSQGEDGGQGGTAPALLLYSSRSAGDIIYRDELELLAANDASFQLFHTLTRKQPAGWAGYSRRLDRDMVAECVSALGGPKLAFICGPDGFVEAAADAAVAAGIPASAVRTERFGPSGS
jgi:ferredoxin-NADP reductase